MRRTLSVYGCTLALGTRGVRNPDGRTELRTSAPRVLVGAVLLAGLWPAAVVGQEVQFLTVTSRNTENVLEWVNPAGYTTVGIRFDFGDPCTPPPDVASGNSLGDEAGPDGGRDRFSHGSLTNGTTYCYSVFVKTGASSYSIVGRSNSGRPMDTTGPVKWAFSIGFTSLTAPTVGPAGIIATSNANVLHAMERGASPPGGEWPASWLPKPLGVLPVQSRSPIIPIDVGGTNPVVYLGSQDGNVYAVDGVKGGAAVADPWLLPFSLGGLAGQAAPAGMFTAFGGSYDYLLVGTSQSGADNRFYAIDPITGVEIDFFDGTGGIGMINGMATVDYANNRVYFTSHERGGPNKDTLWRLDLGPGPVFSLGWKEGFGSIDSSPVLMGGRVYVMGGDNFLYSVDAADGRSYEQARINDGQVKDFIWPDWRNPGDLYFATATCVWAYHWDGTGLIEKFGGCISLPGGAIPTSGVLVINQRVYVGADDGRLHEIDLSGVAPIFDSVPLGHPGPAPPPAAVGSPSLDWPNSLIHVGTEAGIFYAVQVPL